MMGWYSHSGLSGTLLVVVGVGVLAVANLLALPPAAFATRLRTGELLRTQ